MRLMDLYEKLHDRVVTTQLWQLYGSDLVNGNENLDLYTDDVRSMGVVLIKEDAFNELVGKYNYYKEQFEKMQGAEKSHKQQEGTQNNTYNEQSTSNSTGDMPDEGYFTTADGRKVQLTKEEVQRLKEIQESVANIKMEWVKVKSGENKENDIVFDEDTLKYILKINQDDAKKIQEEAIKRQMRG